jgi:hypothetical protein
VLGEQADEEVHPAEVAVGQLFKPGPDFRFDLDLEQSDHASDAICILCYSRIWRGPFHVCIGPTVTVSWAGVTLDTEPDWSAPPIWATSSKGNA